MGIRENVMYGTGATEGDGTGIEASGDGGRGLDVEDDEGGSTGGIECRGSELEVVQCPTQRVHAFLAFIHSYQHATKVSTTRHRYLLWFGFSLVSVVLASRFR